MATAKKPTPMDPNQLNRFWKHCIQKEEAIYGESNKGQAHNILTHAPARAAIPAMEDHLVGTGAIMRTPDAQRGKTKDIDAGSVASMRSAAKSTGGSQAGSKAGSKVSKAGSSAEIMNRLAALEKELMAERERRHMAESQMMELLGKPE